MRRGRAIFLAAALASAGAGMRGAQHPQRAAPAPSASGGVSGVVRAADGDRRPMRDALVMIAGTDVPFLRVTATDAAGRFAFAGVPAGHFLLGAQKSSYVPALYGATHAGGRGQTLTIAAGERRNDVLLSLMRGASVAGRVTDDAGLPVVGARVRMLQRRLVAGEVSLSGDVGDPAGATTDDRGEYRIYDLPPGEYVLLIQPRGGPGPNVRVLTEADIDERPSGLRAPAVAAVVLDAPTYYPGTGRAADAESVALEAGQERTGLDVRTSLARLARIDGSVSDDEGALPPFVQVNLRPSGQNATGAVINSFTARPAPDGRFVIASVPPGRYTLLARALPPPRSPDGPNITRPWTPLWVMREITVSGENIADIDLRLQAPLSLSGHVVFEGLEQPPPTLLSSVHVVLRPTAATGGPAPEPVLTDEHGRFTVKGLFPGRYYVAVTVSATDGTQIPDWIAKSAIANGRDVLDVPLDVGPDAAGTDITVTVTVTKQMQEVSGIVRDAHGAAAGDATVVVFPVDPRGWFPQSRRIAIRPSHSDGVFFFGVAQALPPGDYYAVAVPNLGAGEQFDPAVLTELARSATRFTLLTLTSVELDLRLMDGAPR